MPTPDARNQQRASASKGNPRQFAMSDLHNVNGSAADRRKAETNNPGQRLLKVARWIGEQLRVAGLLSNPRRNRYLQED